ncbi:MULTISPECIES: LTA synthase family protein [unclassified Staphylococcus]|uniref:LTA synthase family protein n=1 Tax=unclassified Staphylococcus TaxID=91994 RepID=UPI0021D3402B|nr:MULTISPECIES: LTA synthase family protein [unclassified Staphylococcus]UXR78250.1 LTA synthase family protein [Staphylococcus sp. IVB6227]UXR82414.1 LTA synthase family protein [Staphylococcus sp. IVB6214]
MQWIIYLVAGLLVTAIDVTVLKQHRTIGRVIKKGLFYLITINIVTLGLFVFVLKRTDSVESTTYQSIFALYYIGIALLFGALWIAVKYLLQRQTQVQLHHTTVKRRWLDVTIKIFTMLFAIIGLLAVYFSNWFIDYFGNITPEQFLFNLKSPIKGTSDGMVEEMFRTPILKALFLAIPLFILVVYNRYDVIGQRQRTLLKRTVMRTLLLLVSLVVLVTGVTYSSQKLRLPEVYEAYAKDSQYIKQNYVTPTTKQYQFPEKKRNLVHIYLESVENSYLSKNLGGYMNENLMSELTELSKEGVHFSDSKDPFGGPHQTYGSSWSVAGMVNMGMGIPLKIPMNGNSYGKSGYFLPGARGIGDILHEEGYEQTIMFGADADFGGLTTYFKSHGNFNIWDWKYARDHGYIPKDYKVWWGFEDDKLYNYAKQEITRLSQTGKPFNFTMETADTHFPDGYVSKNTPTPRDNQYANVIAYSTSEAVAFVRWLQQQPYYENTTIVITGDHLSMDKKFFKDFDPDYKRDIFNLIINPAKEPEKVQNRQFAPLDMFPTILSSMGVEIKGDRLGLGTDLFSETPTLIERDGLEKFDSEISMNSNYYNKQFVSERGSGKQKVEQ